MSRARDFADLAGSADAGGLTGKNLIINGAFQVWQRGTAATDVGGNDVYNTADRWVFYETSDGAFTTEQSTDVPSGQGFEYSLKAAVTTADTSLSSGQFAIIGQKIEAQNLSRLNYGTSSAKTMTLSFWAKSNKTGTYCFSIEKDDETDYIFIKEFSISSADTWEKKTINIIPDSNIKASGGAITHDNGTGFRLLWSFALGSTYTGGTDGAWTTATDFGTTNQVNWLDSTSNEWYITGVQLEVGEQATPFEHRSYGDELLRCQRYYERYDGWTTGEHMILLPGRTLTSNRIDLNYKYKVTKRAAPALTIFTDNSSGGSSPEIIVYPSNATRETLSGESTAISGANITSANIRTTGGATFTSNHAATGQMNTDFAFDAEL